MPAPTTPAIPACNRFRRVKCLVIDFLPEEAFMLTLSIIPPQPSYVAHGRRQVKPEQPSRTHVSFRTRAAREFSCRHRNLGIPGPNTTRAVRAFQASIVVAETGTIDDALIA
jgi:peptidoglycan hydrolase-like protein with peptidoglycan-binding domain